MANRGLGWTRTLTQDGAGWATAIARYDAQGRIVETHLKGDMKHLVLSADYINPSIRDELTGDQSDLNSLEIPATLALSISQWNEKYQPIIPTMGSARNRLTDRIESLDGIGLALAQEMAEVMGGRAKVKYYSEGRQEFIFR